MKLLIAAIASIVLLGGCTQIDLAINHTILPLTDIHLYDTPEIRGKVCWYGTLPKEAWLILRMSDNCPDKHVFRNSELH